MGKIKVHEFSSLDGVVQGPDWTFEFGFTERMGEVIGGLTGSSSAILLGRRTHEMFAPAWSARTAEDDPGAPFFNDTTKYVVSTTMTDPAWKNSEVIGGYDPEKIRALKASADGDVFVSGSITLVRALLTDGLVDELHLFVYPIALGSGLRLFADGGPRTKLSLLAGETFENGVAHLVYGPA